MAGGAAVALLIGATSAVAQVRTFNIPSEPAAKSIPEFARQAGLQITAPVSELHAVKTPAIVGQLDVNAALERLLKDTGLEIASANGSTIILRRRPATAQAQPIADAGAEPDLLNEVVVTALRRSQRLQDVPAAIDVVSGERLARMNAKGFGDYLNNDPGVSYSDQGYYGSRFAIRGVSDGYQPTDALTGVYLDEAPVSQGGAVNGSPTFDPTLYDVDRVEILKGPQGTLYGSGAMGGTVRIILNKPDLQAIGGSLSASIGQVDHGGTNWQGDGALNVPIVQDRLALRLVAGYRDDAGYIDDPSRGAKDVNSVKKGNARAALRFRPEPDTTIDLSAIYQHESFGAAPKADAGLGQYQQSRKYGEGGSSEIKLYGLTVTHDFGGANLVSSTNYMAKQNAHAIDSTRVFGRLLGNISGVTLKPTEGVGLADHPRYSQVSQEVRLASQGERQLDWLVGAYYQHGKTVGNEFIDVGQSPTLSALLTNDEAYHDVFSDRTQQIAGFGEVTYHLTSRLSAAAGLRVFKVDQHRSDHGDGLLNGGPSETASRAKETSHIEKFNLSYKLAQDDLIYAQAAQGYRNGGGNTPVPKDVCGADLAALGYAAAPSQYPADKLWNYEVGSKNTLLGGKVTLNAAAYYIDWRDLQTSVNLPTCLFSFQVDGGHATSKGAELAASVKPVRGLTISGSAAYTDAKLTSAAAGSGLEAGQALPFVSKWSSNLNAQYDFPLAAAYDGFVRGEINYYGPRWTQFEALAGSVQLPAATVLNLSLGVTHDTWSVSLSANNLLDARVLNQKSILGLTPGEYLGEPRVVSLSARNRF